MSLPFAKAEACGNDFLLVALEHCVGRDLAALSRALCDRHRGPGADGVEFYAWSGGRLRLELFNADGSPAEISGNGTRCAAAWMASRHGFREGSIRTGGGERWTTVLGEEAGAWQVESRMGAPDWRAEAVPLRGAAALGPGRWRLPLPAGEVECFALSLGNPQCCLQVNEFAPDWAALAKRIQDSGCFPQGVNVEFWRRLQAQAIEIRIFERGVGETLSSGTGSTAAAVAAIAAGVVRSPVRVVSPGGEQTVAWEGGSQEARLRGWARIVAEGVYLGTLP